MSMNNNTTIKSATNTIIKINLRFLQALLFSLIAWWSFPSRYFYYGWGLLSIISVLVVLACLASAIKSMVIVYRRDKAISAYLQQGAQPKSSTLASDDALKNAGMR